MKTISRISQSTPLPSNSKASPFRRTRPHSTIDTITSIQEQRPSNTGSDNKSPIKMIIDMLDCIQYFIISQGKKLVRMVLRALQHITHSSSPFSQAMRDIAGASSESESLPDPQPEVDGQLIIFEPTEVREARTNLEDQVFRGLRLTEEDVETINYIITTLATANAFNMPSTELREKGKTIRPIHPLKFLSYIFNTPAMLENLVIMKNRLMGIIWAQFIDEIGDKLTEAVSQGNFEQYIDAFSRSIHRDPIEVRRKIAEESWTKFIEFLLQRPVQDIAESSDASHSLSDRDTSHTPPSSPLRTKLSREQLPRTRSQDHSETLQSPARGITRSMSMQQTPKIRSAPTGRTRHYSLENQEELEFDPESTIQITDPRLLPISSDQKESIENILATIANNNYFMLGIYTMTLRSKWSTLKDINALRILLELFNTTTNFTNLNLIMEDSLKKKHFLEDLIKVLVKTPSGSLAPYIENFAHLMGVTSDSIDPFIMIGDAKSWKNLVKYIYSVQQLVETSEENSVELS